MRALYVEYYTHWDLEELRRVAPSRGHEILRWEDMDTLDLTPEEEASLRPPAPPPIPLARRLLRIRPRSVSARVRNLGMRVLFGSGLYRDETNDSDRRRRKVTAVSEGRFREHVERHRIETVVIPHEFPWLSNLGKFARRLGLPVVWLHKEGLIAPVGEEAQRSGTFRSNVMCCPGRWQQRIWSAKPGADPSRILVTGFPRLDYYARRSEWPRRAAVFERYGLRPDRPLVLFPSFPPLWNLSVWDATGDREDSAVEPWKLDGIWPVASRVNIDNRSFQQGILRGLFRLLRRHRGRLQVAVKLHPWQKRIPGRVSFRERAFGWGVFPGGRLVEAREDIRDLLANADLAVAHNCTTLMEAMIAGTPTALLKWSAADRFALVPYAEWNTMPAIRSEAEFVPAVEGLLARGGERDLYREGRDRIIEEFVHRPDGKATERFFDVLDRVAAGEFALPARRAPSVAVS